MNMKKKFFPLLALMAALLLAGCEEKAATATDLVVVTLNGSNMPILDADLTREYVTDAASAPGSTVSLIIADGAPSLAGDVIQYGERESRNEVHWTQELEARCAEAEALFTANFSHEAETDLLRALGLAARQLASGSGKDRLVVLHSGLNTCSPLPMQDIELTTLGTDTVNELAAQGYLADLDGCIVDWYFLGDVLGPQDTLEESQVQALRTFWETYLEQAGATVSFHSDLPSTGEAEGAPPVSTVSVRAVSLEPVVLDSSILKFIPDSDQVADEQAALLQLSELAETLKSTHASYILAGLTADVEQTTLEDSQALGLARAVRAQSLLDQLGVPGGQLICVGVGKAPVSVRDKNDQTRNRSVWLVPLDSELGAELLAVGVSE